MKNKPLDLGLNKKRIAESFNRSAETYDYASILHREVGRRMIDRLEFMLIEPEIVLDVGAATGYCARLLSKRYPEAKHIAFDIALNMMQSSKNCEETEENQGFVCGDAEKLPFADNSVDFIFSCFAFQWFPNLNVALEEMFRVLKPEGLLMFASFGPDTLAELRYAWNDVDDYTHVNTFLDMHDVGDSLIQSGYSDPVMDMDMMALEYDSVKAIMKDLKQLGAHNIIDNRPSGLMGKGKMQKMIDNYETFRDSEGLLPASYEVIYGHAWGKETPPISHMKPDDVRVNLTDIGRIK